jgi:hypothetical protein
MILVPNIVEIIMKVTIRDGELQGKKFSNFSAYSYPCPRACPPLSFIDLKRARARY